MHVFMYVCLHASVYAYVSVHLGGDICMLGLTPRMGRGRWVRMMPFFEIY